MNPRSLLVFALIPVIGCSDAATTGGTGTDDEPSAAAQGSDSVAVTDDEAQALTLTVDGAPTASTAAQIAQAQAANVGTHLTPAGCYTATIAGATVTYGFDDCTGPRGMVHLKGTIDVTYSYSAAGVHAHVATTDFYVNSSKISVDADVVYLDTGTSKTVTVSTDSSGTGPLGFTVAHKGSYTASWTDSCHTLSGSWSTTANALSRSTTVSEYSRCESFCPAAGGTFSHTFRGGSTLTLTFEGATLAWSVNGRSGTIDLPCTPES